MNKIIFFLFSAFFVLLYFIEPTISIQKNISIFSVISLVIFSFILISFQKLIIPKVISLLFILFIFWINISIFQSRDINNSIWESLKMISFFALFLTVYNLVLNNLTFEKKIFSFFLALTLCLLIFDLFVFLNSGGLINKSYFIGSLKWHNQMGGFLLFIIPPLFGYLLNNISSPIKKYLIISALITSVMALIFTYSRGSWLSLALAMTLFSLFEFKKIKSQIKLLGAMLSMILIVLILIVKPSSVMERAQSIKADLFPTTRSVSGNLRVTVWENSLKMFASSPIFGVGAGAFGITYFQFQKDPWLYSQYAHNYFLEILAEFGTIGFILFILILGTVAYFLYRGKNTIKKDKVLLGIAVSIFASLLHAFVDIDFSRILLYLIFWSYLAILLSKVTIEEWVIEIVGVKKAIYAIPFLFLVLAVILVWSDTYYNRAQKYSLAFNLPRAEQNIRKAIIYNPFNGKSYFLLGQINESQNQDEKAKEAYQKALLFSSSDPKPYFRLANIEFRKGNYEGAKKLLGESLKKAPYGNLDAYVALAEIYSRENATSSAQKVLRTAIYKAFPLNESYKGFEYLYEKNGFKKELASVYLDLAKLNLQLNNYNEAKKLIQIVKKDLDPKNSSLPFLEENVVK